jgi:type IV pilus assembly protein PilQ
MRNLTLKSHYPAAPGPAPAPHALGLALLLGMAWFLAPATAAATRLQDVDFTALPGDRVRIDLTFSGPVRAPTDFATDSPARIALDFADVKSGLQRKSIPISLGPVDSLVSVEAQGRTRVVINLDSPAPYDVGTSGDRVTVAIAPTLTAPAPAPVTPSPPRRRPVAPVAAGPGIRDIDFRRGPSGEGRVLIHLPSARTGVDVTQQGKRVVAKIPGTTLPSRLLRRLDVADFATPVLAVESRPKGGDVEVTVETTGAYDYLAYQADRLFTLELRPLTPAAKEKQRGRQVSYSGDRLSLNFQDIEVRAVLQLLADFTGLNLVASDTVTGNITLRLKNVPWDQALDIILKTKGLSMRQMGNVVMVAPTQELAAQEKLELESQQQIEELAPLRSEFIQINYAKASDLAALLKADENRLLSERGNVTVDERTNTLLVQDTPVRLEDIRRIVGRLDVPVRQVMIESRIVIANNDFARDLGVRFGFSRYQENRNDGRFNTQTGGVAPLTRRSSTPTSPFVGGEVYGGYQQPDDFAPLMVNLPAANPSGAVNFLIGKVGSYLLQLELSAMQREGRGEIISSPRVITSDQYKATITVGQEIPYQSTVIAGGAQSANIQFKEAVLKLDVTPHITPDDRIIMDLDVRKDNPDFTREINGVPPVDTRSVQTSVLVDNGETVVLGGVYERTKGFSKEQVPWLGNLPVIGNLFRTTNRQDDNSELLIFVTPKILKENLGQR